MKIETAKELTNGFLVAFPIADAFLLFMGLLISEDLNATLTILVSLGMIAVFTICFFICIVARILLELLPENKE